MKRYNFFLPESAVETLKDMAAAKGVTYSDLIRQAIKHFLKLHGRSTTDLD